jgi:hypothetical protein
MKLDISLFSHYHPFHVIVLFIYKVVWVSLPYILFYEGSSIIYSPSFDKERKLNLRVYASFLVHEKKTNPYHSMISFVIYSKLINRVLDKKGREPLFSITKESVTKITFLKVKS